MYLDSEFIKQLNAFLEEHKDVSFTSAQLYSNFFEPLTNVYNPYILPNSASNVTKVLTEPENWKRICIKAEKIKNRYYFQYEKKYLQLPDIKK